MTCDPTPTFFANSSDWRERYLVTARVVPDISLLAIGMSVGLIASWTLTRFVASQLYGISRNDPRTLIAAIAGLLLISALAGYAPGRRATRIHPMEALRWE